MAWVAVTFAANQAFAVDYTWTGAAGNGSWKDAANWGGGGCPQTADDVAIFTTSATVTFDMGPDTPLRRIDAKTADTEVVIHADASGSSILAGSSLVSIDGETTKLTLNVPVRSETENFWVVQGGSGEVHFTTALSYDNNQKPNYWGSLARLYLEGNFSEDSKGMQTFGWLANSPDDKALEVFIRDSAQIVVTNRTVYGNRGILTFVGGYSTRNSNVVVEQDGANSLVRCNVLNLGCVSESSSALREGTYARYVLKSGRLDVLQSFTVGGKAMGTFVQQGGSVCANSLTFGEGLSKEDRFAILGGTFEVGTMGNTDVIPIELSNCTFKVGANWDATTPVVVSGPVTFEVAKGAAVTLRNVTLTDGGTIEQAGEGQLAVFLASDYGPSAGLLEVSELGVGGATSANEAVFTGGTVNMARLSSASKGRFVLDGATLVTREAFDLTGTSGFEVEFRSGTYAPTASATYSVPVKLTGEVAFDVPDGVTVRFAATPAFGTKAKVVKRGAGTLSFDCEEMVRFADFDIEAGTVTLPGRLKTARNETLVRNFTIRDGGILDIGSAWAQYGLAIDLVLEGQGYIKSTANSPSVFSVRSYTKDGEKQPRGGIWCAPFATADVPFRSSYSAASARSQLAVAYVWTGLGDGVSWSDANNWADGEMPAKASYNTYADLSDARYVKVTEDVEVAGIVYYGGKNGRTLVLEADADSPKRVAAYTKQYQAASYVNEGCEVVFRNVKFIRSTTSGNQVGYVGGFGEMVFEGNEQGTYPIVGHMDGDRVFRFVTNATYSTALSSLNYSRAGAAYRIGSGTDMRFDKVHAGLSGHSQLGGFHLEENCKVFFKTGLYATRHNGMFGFDVFMRGGEVTIEGEDGLSVGTSDVPTETVYGKETFTMSDGKLIAPRIGCDCNANYIYLEGGELRIGNGGFVKTETNAVGKVGAWNPNADAPVKWGGTKVVATDDFAFGLAVELTGRGGEPTLDVPEGRTVTFKTNLTGQATLAKVGTGTLVLTGSVSPVSLRIDAGKLSFAVDTDFSSEMGTLSLASDANLVLASGQSLKVKGLVVGGVAKPSGTFAWGAGEVVVVESTADDWLAAAAYTKDCRVTLNGQRTLDALAYAYSAGSAGTLTISGSGTLAFDANTTVFVREGDTLVFDVPVTLAGRLDIVGGGNVVFEPAATVAASSGSLFVRDGSAVVLRSIVNGGEEGLNVFCVTQTLRSRYSTLRIESDGRLCQRGRFPTCSSEDKSVGGVFELAEGGTFDFLGTDSETAFAGSASRMETFRLCGGRLKLPFGARHGGGSGVAEFGSGAVEVGNPGTVLTGGWTISLSGIVALDVSGASAAFWDATVMGAGELVKTGDGTLILNGDLSGLTGAIVLTGGDLKFSDAVREASCKAATIRVQDGRLVLDYNGEMPVGSLFLGSRELRKGVYGADVKPGRYSPVIVGKGLLSVLNGNPPGGLIVIR